MCGWLVPVLQCLGNANVPKRNRSFLVVAANASGWCLGSLAECQKCGRVGTSFHFALPKGFACACAIYRGRGEQLPCAGRLARPQEDAARGELHSLAAAPFVQKQTLEEDHGATMGAGDLSPFDNVQGLLATCL